jgi:two-component system sensor histidine kinase RegB
VESILDKLGLGARAAREDDAGVTSSAARRARQLAVGIVARAPLPGDSADRWLVQLRWLALVGMSATVLLGKRLVPGIAVAPLVGALSLIAVVNVAWSLALRGATTREPRFVAAQLATDLGLVTVLLWHSGGLRSPFAVFLTFHLALAGILTTWRTTIGLLALTFGAIVVLLGADPLPLEGAPIGRASVELLAGLVSMASLTAFLGFVVLAYARRLERYREEAARNEKLAMLGRLVGGMSHELATPLATIVLASGDLAEMTAAEGGPEAAGLARTIAEEARRASDLIGLMRGHIRPDERAEAVDLAALVSDIASVELDRLAFDGERVVRARGPQPASVMTVALRHVLRNLLQNAAHATEGVAAPRIEVEVAARRGALEVRVADNGPGFSDEVLAHVGEPFRTTKEAEGGMGLGLYVCSVLARQMGGELRVGQGAAGGAEVVLRLGTGAGGDAEEAA